MSVIIEERAITKKSQGSVSGWEIFFSNVMIFKNFNDIQLYTLQKFFEF